MESTWGIITNYFTVEEFEVHGDTATFYVQPLGDIKNSFLKVYEHLKQYGLTAYLRSFKGRIRLVIIPKPKVKPSKTYVNIILLILTIATTTFVGYNLSIPLFETGLMSNPFIGASSFSVAIMMIIGLHELGHKLAARKWNIQTSLPYFIPVPFFLGTLGAVIVNKETPPNRDALYDLGATGPILGFIISILFAFIGISISYPIPRTEAPMERIVFYPTPILFELITSIMLRIPKDHILIMHPVAFASWVGMIITMLNLMPAGSLDGGHVARALFGGRKHQVISIIIAWITYIIGYPLMAIIMLLFSLYPHPGPLDDISQLTTSRKLLAIPLFTILYLCGVPGWIK
ncbi:MAG: site-2 protease family protein [Candidatus Methanomethylicia archaeon]